MCRLYFAVVETETPTGRHVTRKRNANSDFHLTGKCLRKNRMQTTNEGIEKIGELINVHRFWLGWAMSIRKSVPLDTTTRSLMNGHVPASKLFYLHLISVISALLLKPKRQSSSIVSLTNLTRSWITWNENMEYRNCQTWITMISFSISHTGFNELIYLLLLCCCAQSPSAVGQHRWY